MLHAFLPELLKLFYPHVEKRLVLDKLEFLDTEVSPNFTTEAAARPMWWRSSTAVMENRSSF